MRSDADDDALSWEGDDALDAPRPAVWAPASRTPQLAGDGAQASVPTPATAAAAEAAADATDAEDEPQGLGTVSLVLLGILGGIYLLYTIGWIIGGVGMQAPVMFTLPAVLYQAALWVAVLAPALWFAAVLVATRGSKDWVRVVWLIAGAALLVPWPFVVSGGGGAL
ncbi:DNA polymerase III subunit gamma/tau [Microbacterium suwonense]|uniref:DNA polymerase III subunit gamma/tau n=1 Tax=Microbacterium suwonense TaxID=683047 RepID=A0ABN6X3C2_9MICO|nr:DNA polymerase III subunit gamma/tau [Microbacterium suwonense]BDZ38508.1 hypothetical protein GCM10025863_11220 [Microbacterium suwonense]